MKIATVLVTSLLSVPAAFAAQTTTPADDEGITVQYADLDLDRKAGIVTLYRRIQGAARMVCDAHSGRMLVTRRSYASCVENAVGTAVVQIGRPALSAHFAQQTGTPVAGATARVAIR